MHSKAGQYSFILPKQRCGYSACYGLSTKLQELRDDGIMLFQTYEFFILFIVTSLLLVLVQNNRAKQVILLCASLIFYSWGSIAHSLLFAVVIIWTYVIARIISSQKNPRLRKLISFIGIILSFFPLFFYKYVPFLITQIFQVVPVPLSAVVSLTLPIGISFYTFQAVGYVIDVYRGDYEAESDIISYGLFISFFPQLVAGPIERVTQLMSQLKALKPFRYNNAATGLRLMGIGLFMKIFVADTAGYIVNFSYNNLHSGEGHANPILLVVATFFFGIQIYCDFNGYSTIARGVAKTMGIELMHNFKQPYFSKSLTEFWRRWHRSLSYWFRDYLFVPLGGSRQGMLRTVINLFVTFLISGIWHGANWTFAIWGALNGVCVVFEKITGLDKKNKMGWFAFAGWVYAYLAINFTWIFFRANSLRDAFYAANRILTSFFPELWNLVTGSIGLFDIFPKSGLYLWNLALSLFGILLIILYDIYEHKYGSFAEKLGKFPAFVRWSVYVGIMLLSLGFGQWGAASQFIYFRF